MDDLEQRLDRHLKELPVPQAPSSLLPRVLLAMAEAEATPWYSRAWVAWPRELQVASAVLLALVVTGLWSLIPAGQLWIADVVSPVAGDLWARVAPALRVASQAATVVRVVWDILLGPMTSHVLVFVVLISFMCAAFWTAVTRVALGGAASQ